VSSTSGRGPLWREEVSIHAGDERYVNRRQFGKFLVLTSLGMLVGNAWILIRSLFHREERWPARRVAQADEVPVGGVKLFRYPTEGDPCILVRVTPSDFVAYSQKCTHLSCAVYYEAAHKRFVCPCHEGFFAVENGSVLQGPPQRPLPRVRLERRGDALFATRIDLGPEV
jgi:Rieske Fe-S protein